MYFKKSITSLILILLSVMTIFIVGCDKSENNRETIIKDTDTALLTIFTFDGKKESSFGLMNLGHSFLSLENISSESFKIGNAYWIPKH